MVVVPERLVAYRKRRQSMSRRSDRMWRSHRLVIEAARERRPDLSRAASGVRRINSRCISPAWPIGPAPTARPWAGACARCDRHSRSGCCRSSFDCFQAVQAAPTVRASFGWRAFSTWDLPHPLIPYDRIYRKRRERRRSRRRPRDDSGPALPRVSDRGGDGDIPGRRGPASAQRRVVVSGRRSKARSQRSLLVGPGARAAARSGRVCGQLLRALSGDRSGHLSAAVLLVEGLAFAAFGPSPYVAKSVVLVFAMVAGLYTMAWTRRWIGEPAGWAGAFLAFIPGSCSGPTQ